MPQDADLSGPLELIDLSTPLLVRICVDAGIFVAFGREERHPDEAAARHWHQPAGRPPRRLGAHRPRRVRAHRRRPLPADRHRTAAAPGRAGQHRRALYVQAVGAPCLGGGGPHAAHRRGRVHGVLRAAVLRVDGRAAGDLDWFNRTMRDRTAALLDAGMPLYDWPGNGTVVDVGGGNGLLLERLLAERPGLRGIVFDQPHVVAEAEERLAAADHADRSRRPAGTSSTRCRRAATSYVPRQRAARLARRRCGSDPAHLPAGDVGRGATRPLRVDPRTGHARAGNAARPVHAGAVRVGRAHPRGVGRPAGVGRLRARPLHPYSGLAWIETHPA